MKLKEEFITYEIAGTQVMVATGDSHFSGLVRSNRTAAFIVDCLKQETTPEEIVQAVVSHFEAPAEAVRPDVRRILDTLTKIGALDV